MATIREQINEMRSVIDNAKRYRRSISKDKATFNFVSERIKNLEAILNTLETVDAVTETITLPDGTKTDFIPWILFQEKIKSGE